MATHLDAPWHFGPTSEGQPSKTIDQIPLEWCISDGVRLDVRHFGRGYLITVQDVKDALAKINYKIKPMDIVLFWTDSDKFMHDPGYTAANPGIGAEATLWGWASKGSRSSAQMGMVTIWVLWIWPRNTRVEIKMPSGPAISQDARKSIVILRPWVILTRFPWTMASPCLCYPLSWPRHRVPGPVVLLSFGNEIKRSGFNE